MKILKRVLDILIVCMVLILLVVIYGNIEKNIFKKSHVNYFGYTFFEVVSGSMEPTINVGDLVIVKLTDDFDVNDIITYKENNYFVTHRVIKKDGRNIIAKGDSNNSADKVIDKDDCIGKVVKVISNVGIWRNVLLNSKVLISILITFALFIYYFSMIERKNEKNEEEIKN